MSLLSDLLSKIKHPESRKDLPPGPRSMVSALKKREFNRKRIIILSVFVTLAVGSGFVTAYLVGTYLTEEILKGRRARSTEQRARSTEQRARSMEQRARSMEHGAKSIGQRAESNLEQRARSREQRAESSLEQRAITIKKKPAVRPEIIARKQEAKTEEAKGPIGVSPEVQTSEMKDLYLYMGGNCEKKGDYPGAISSYKKVLDIEPGNYRVMNKIAYIFVQMALYEEALKYLGNALTSKHDYVPALINAGVVYAKEEKFSEAEKYFLKVLALEEINPTALFNLALLYEREGNYEKAREYYVRLQRLGDVQGNLGLERIQAGTTSK